MYHFLFVLTGKLFRNFNKGEKIDPEKEQIINFCPKCNEELADKKVKTLYEHDKKKHPKTEKEIVKDFYSKGSVRVWMIMFTCLFVGISFVGISEINEYFWFEELSEEELSALEFCKDLDERFPTPPLPILTDMEKRIQEREEFILNNFDDMKKCNYNISATYSGTKDQRVQNYLESEEEP